MNQRNRTNLSKGLILLLMVWFTTSTNLRAEEYDPQTVREKVHAYRVKHEIAILQALIDFLSIPNVASDRANIQKNADHLVSMLQHRGIKTQLLEVDDSPPVVFGTLNSLGAEHTIILYAHYDGQPVVPSKWKSDPRKPVLRDNSLEEGGREIPIASLQSPIPGKSRLYARSASDDKSPIVTMLAALDALQEAGIPLSINLKFFFEGEEEAGSPHLPTIIQKYGDLLKADAWILCDGPVHQSRQMQVYFGARGVVGLEMTIYGANRSLHSGHYGNWAPNPIILLTHLLSSMRDSESHIRIAGFYDEVRPLSIIEQKALTEISKVDNELKYNLGLAQTEGGGAPLVNQIMRPALNLRGIQSGQVSVKAKNAIPTEAKASIDFRLVPDQTPQKVRSLVEKHIRKQGYFIVNEPPDMETRRKHPKIIKLQWGKGYPPARTSMELPVSQSIIQVIEEALGSSIVKMPSLGGSIPMYLFLDVLKTPVIGVPMVNHDNNQHAPNENLRIQNLWDGIEIYASILARLGQVWQ